MSISNTSHPPLFHWQQICQRLHRNTKAICKVTTDDQESEELYLFFLGSLHGLSDPLNVVLTLKLIETEREQIFFHAQTGLSASGTIQ